MSFKKDFAWGTATAAYQIEGAYNEDGKGLSVWDVFAHTEGKIKFGHTGDVACDHYHRYKEDVKLLKELGIKAYRFSISWPRIFPNGVGEVNEKGVKFYSNLIDELIKNGITPYITLFHWDYPYELYKKGGWLNPDCVKWFADYAAKIVELYSDRVEYFITFNEPQSFIGGGHFLGEHAPGLKMSIREALQACHNVLKSHGAAVKAMRKAAKRDIKIGYAPSSWDAAFPHTETPEDIEATRKFVFATNPDGYCLFDLAWWSDPVVLGKYPEDGLEIYKDYLPEITPEDMALINQPLDFYAQNFYDGGDIKADENGEPIKLPRKKGFTKTAIGWGVMPKVMRWTTRFLYERYKLPIVITENGMSAHDGISLDGKVHDPNRIDFLNRYLLELEKATDDGVDVAGYFVWSFLDNYEWAEGYNDRFGIVYVDYETLKRTPKDSAYWYKEWIENHSK